MMREDTPVLGIPFGFVFAPFILFLLAIGLLYIRKLIVLFGPKWEVEIGEVGVATHAANNAESVE
ncbi:hypothetical protein D3C86_2145630 [compost metagenome]